METLRATNSVDWGRICSDTFVPLEAATGASFEGRIEHVKLSSLGVSRVVCDPCRVARSDRAIRGAPSDDVLVNIVEAGTCTMSTGDGQAVLPAGVAALCDADRPYTLGFAAPGTVMTLQVPRSVLPRRSPRRIGALASTVASTTSSATVLRHFLHGVLEAGATGIGDVDELASTTVGLLSLVMTDADRQLHPPGEPLAPSAHFLLIRDFVDRHCTDSGLTVEQIARRHRVSRRYLENLFARHGGSPSAYLRAARLERARALLEADGRLPLVEVALRSGFSDVTTFGRAFRRAHGTTPGAWRR
ncbi:helix-turn-helix domain-containing protein [Pseudonocardia spinosispora]|uniref:helix-turn-helix domain-containing protein n=1 Tax=Pseudonocardia spinosispora TaxID=103441 RepID=UPI00042A844B|nr:helix-turn-helix domain-containing protein [Pseudonocardia spinosispora]